MSFDKISDFLTKMSFDKSFDFLTKMSFDNIFIEMQFDMIFDKKKLLRDLSIFTLYIIGTNFINAFLQGLMVFNFLKDKMINDNFRKKMIRDK